MALTLLLLSLTTCRGDATGPPKGTVGPAGGSFSLAQGTVKLSIPSGALSGEVELTATLASSFPASGLIVPGSTYDIGPTGTAFAKPVTITITYDPASLPDGVRENELRLFQAVGGTWATALNPSVDTEAHTVSGRVTSLGVFGAKGVSVATVEVAPPHFTLEQGGTKGFSALGRDASGLALPDRVMTWSSSAATVAVVDADGLVTATGVGSSTIVAEVEGRSAHAEVNTWNCRRQSGIPEVECEALIDFYDGVGEQDWRYASTWVPTPDPCTWSGVTCGGGHVTKFRLGPRQLPGSVSSSLGNLSGLTELDLSGNRLTGPIPTSLGSLSDLSRLDLFSNLLSGEIPSDLKLLAKLTWLNLSGNELVGSIPPGLGDLSNLTELSLNWNQLSGSIPPELGNLGSLVRLGLLDNQLTGPIPAELGDLANLQDLSLGFSPLSGLIPPELGKLTRLTSLGISQTNISGPIPAELGALVNLEWMILNGNRLSGHVPLSVAQLGGTVQAKDGGGPKCSWDPQESTGLTLPDTQEYRDADLNGDGKICGVTIGAG